jgi:hypothetical protein
LQNSKNLFMHNLSLEMMPPLLEEDIALVSKFLKRNDITSNVEDIKSIFFIVTEDFINMVGKVNQETIYLIPNEFGHSVKMSEKIREQVPVLKDISELECSWLLRKVAKRIYVRLTEKQLISK